jgi:hypothetical protein
VLTTALRVLVRCWPALLAWFLLGWTVRALIIRGAGYLLNVDENFGLLLLPLAILAQLAAFVGMFLAIRRELPHVLRAGQAEPGSRGPLPDAVGAVSATRQWRSTVVAAILPFFLLYIAWNLVRDDGIDLYAASLYQDNFGTADSLASSNYYASVVIMVIAFAARWLLGRFAARLPPWTTLVVAYLEAVWAFIFLFLIRDLLGLLGAWLATRRMFAGLVDAWADVRENFAWIGVIGDGVGWVWAQIGTLVGLPLAWLAFAAIIYFGTMPRTAQPGPAVGRAATERWARMPAWMRRIGSALSAGVLDRWRPVVLAARLIWRAGPITMGTYLLAFAIITAASEWLRMLVYRLVGPHNVGWWFGASDVIELAIDAVLAVVQICVVAAAFDHALRSDTAENLVDDAGDAVSSAAAPAVAPPTR